MKKLLKTMAVAVSLSALVAMEAMAVESPGGSVIEDGGNGDGGSTVTDTTPGSNPAEEIYNEVVVIGEDGVPMVSPDASPELLEIFQEYYDINDDGVPMAKTPEMETSPKTGEDNTLIALS